MRISIIGLGWFGAPLALALKEKHEVSGSTRDEGKRKEFNSNGVNAHILTPPAHPSADLLNADVVVLNIPPFEGQLDWFKSWDWNKQAHLVFISSTSVYGKNEGLVTEETVPLPDSPNAQLLLKEEAWVRSFNSRTIIRFGGLIGGNRHPGKILSGRKGLKGGDEPVNLIHLEDTLHFTEEVIEKKITGTFNLVHPEHPSRQNYYQSYCQRHGLTLPEFEPGGEGKVVSSEKVSSFYRFRASINI